MGKKNKGKIEKKSEREKWKKKEKKTESAYFLEPTNAYIDEYKSWSIFTISTGCFLYRVSYNTFFFCHTGAS